MTNRLDLRLALIAFTVLAAACGSGSDNASTPTSPSPVAASPSPSPSPSPTPTPSPGSAGCNATVTGLPSTVGGGTNRYTFSIAIATSCAWTARTDVNWADVAPGSGNGNGTPTLTVNENGTFFGRSFVVTINGQNFTVSQAQTTCSFSLDRNTLDVSADGETQMIQVTTSEGCGWTASASESWIRVVTTSGTGTSRVYFEIAPNTGDVRHAYVTIAGLRVDVTQRRRG
jgi:hypothetical protein